MRSVSMTLQNKGAKMERLSVALELAEEELQLAQQGEKDRADYCAAENLDKCDDGDWLEARIAVKTAATKCETLGADVDAAEKEVAPLERKVEALRKMGENKKEEQRAVAKMLKERQRNKRRNIKKQRHSKLK